MKKIILRLGGLIILASFIFGIVATIIQQVYWYNSDKMNTCLYISTQHEQTIHVTLPRDCYSVIACHKDKTYETPDDKVRHLSETPWCVISDGEKEYEVYTRRFEFKLNEIKTVTLRVIPNEDLRNSGYTWFELSVNRASHHVALPFQMEKMKIAN